MEEMKLEQDIDPTKGTSRKIGCCEIPPSPYPMLAANAFFIMVFVINRVLFDAVIYNKICFDKFADFALCSNKTFTAGHPAIQQEALKWGTYSSVAQLPLAILVTLLLCSYCDRVGHKLPYVLPSIGSLISTIYLSLLATPQFIGWPIGSVIGYSIFLSMLGNATLVLMSSFSYVALLSTKDNRAVSMAICEGSLMLGLLIGNGINGPIVDATSVATLAYITVGLTVLPFIIVTLFVTDVTSSSHNYTWRDAIGFSHLLDAFRCVFKKRDGSNRLLLNLSFVVYSLAFFSTAGGLACDYLYFVKERGMSMSTYSGFAAFQTIMRGFGGPIVLILLKKFVNVSRNTIIVFSCFSLALAFCIISVAAIPGSQWIGSIFFFTQTIFYGEVRSLQTSLCGRDEFGIMFAYDALLQLLLVALASVLYKSLYSASIVVWPEAFLALSAVLNMSAMAVALIMNYIQSHPSNRLNIT